MEGYCYGSMCSQSGSRNFLTKEEKLDILKEYKTDLEKETQGVAERIAQMEKD